MLLKDLPLYNKVKFGSFWHPSKDIELVCAKSVRRLVTKVVGNDDFWGMAGSVTLVIRHGKHFGVFCRHQLGCNPENPPQGFEENYLVPSLRPQFKNLSVKSIKFSTNHKDEEFSDIVAFELNPNDEDVKKETPYFAKALLG